jgi:hypothetical protein
VKIIFKTLQAPSLRSNVEILVLTIMKTIDMSSQKNLGSQKQSLLFVVLVKVTKITFDILELFVLKL